MIDLDGIPYVPCRDRRARTQPPVAVCIHTAETAERLDTAEAIATYFARGPLNADGTPRRAGIHYSVDVDSITCSARPEQDTVPHCYKPSSWSIGIEHAGRAGQGVEGWADDYSVQMLERSAQLTAALCQRYGIPPRRLTVAEVRAGAPGIFGHADATAAFAVAGGHSDPGPHWPWAAYLARVVEILAPPPPLPPPTDEETDTMGATVAQLDTITNRGPVAVSIDGMELRAHNGGRFVGPDIDPAWRVEGLDGSLVPDVINLAAIPIVGRPTDVLRLGVSAVALWTIDDAGRRYAYAFQVGTA